MSADDVLDADQPEVIYTARVTSYGGRKGRLQAQGGVLNVKTDLPQALTGVPARGTNPEELLAGAYASCFLSSLTIVGPEDDLKHVEVTVHISLRRVRQADFRLSAEIHVSLPMLTQDEARRLMLAAHKICPMSRALKGNVDVAFFVSQSKG